MRKAFDVESAPFERIDKIFIKSFREENIIKEDNMLCYCE
jgi:hypothetical protein